MTHDLTNPVYDTLFWSQVKDDPEPWLAESAEPSPDRKQWTIKLRPGVTWHDGRPLTAEDVAFTFQQMKSTTGGLYNHVWEYPVFESADVIGALTVRLNFTDAAPTFKILPRWRHAHRPEAHLGGRRQRQPATDIPSIGSGPYKLASFVPNQICRLEANPNDYKVRPKVDAIDPPRSSPPPLSWSSSKR